MRPETVPRSGSAMVHVVAGALFNASGEVLIAQRPAHKIYPGQWEFPGGKIERGETARQALDRELHEELGVDVQAARPAMRLRHSYPEFNVLLDVWRVDRFAGTPLSAEHPALAWVSPEDLGGYALLAADAPLVTALRLPPLYVFTPPAAGTEWLLSGLVALPHRTLLRLRLPGVKDDDYESLASTLLPACRAHGLGLILDRDPAMVARLGARGWHASATRLTGINRRPVEPGTWFAASCHNVDELRRAQSVDADMVVLGPVNTTATHPAQPPLTWTGFTALADTANLPVYAIGGLGSADLDAAWQAGAQGVAGISAFWPQSVRR